MLVHEFVTGGGQAAQDLTPSWAAEGSAMRLAVARELTAITNVHVIMTLDQRIEPEAGPWSIVRVGPGREEDTLDRLASAADATVLIAPETAGILQDRARRIELVGGRSLGSAPGAIALCGDKALLAHYLEERGIPTPGTRVVDSAVGLPVDFPYPAVLKPVDGAGCLDTFAIGNPDQLPPAAANSTSAILQPYLFGLPVSASFLVGVDGKARLVGIGRQHVEVVNRQFRYLGGTVPLRPEPLVADIARRAVEAVRGLRGWVGVDLIWNPDDGSAFVLEINPRVTTSFVGFRSLVPAGDLARAWLAALGEFPAGATTDLRRTIANSSPVRFSAFGEVAPAELVS